LSAYNGAIVEQETIEAELSTQQIQPQEPTEYGSAHTTAANDNTQEPAENGSVNQPTEYGTPENDAAAGEQPGEGSRLWCIPVESGKQHSAACEVQWH
jgi:hypothetical protein